MKYLHTMVRVTDLESSLRFYRDALGLEVLRQQDVPGGRFTLVFLAAPGDSQAQIELTYNWDPEVYEQGRNFGHIAYAVDNIYEVCSRLQDHGVTINRPPRDGYMAFVRSPDNISIELLQRGGLCRRQTHGSPCPTLATGEGRAASISRVRDSIMQIDDENRISGSAASNHTPKLWPGTRVVARLPGSLPDGGTIPLTPVFAYEQTPAALTLSARPELRPCRHDIDLDGLLAFVIDDVVTADEADAIVAASENFGFREEAPGISTPPGMRMNKTVHWLADDALLGPIFERIRDLLPSRVDGFELSDRLSHRLNIYRYDEQDQFRRHTDGDWPGFGLDKDRASVQQWQGAHSCLTMLLYLNDRGDGFEGGATRLFSRQGRFQDITPRKGSALFFRHGFSMGSVVHEGLPVSGSASKYVARINVLYQ